MCCFSPSKFELLFNSTYITWSFCTLYSFWSFPFLTTKHDEIRIDHYLWAATPLTTLSHFLTQMLYHLIILHILFILIMSVFDQKKWWKKDWPLSMICPPEPLPPKPLGYNQGHCVPNQGTWQFNLTPPKLLGHHPSRRSTNLLATLKNDERGVDHFLCSSYSPYNFKSDY